MHSPIDVFVSKPYWIPPMLERRLDPLFESIDSMGFRVNTLGDTHAAIRSPFDDMCSLMKRCKCTIVLGMPYIFITKGKVKHSEHDEQMILTTEWNQIETAVSLTLGHPTLVLLHKNVSDRGLFAPGAANVFVHRFDVLRSDWLSLLKPALTALRNAVDA